jgi:hypothetical protein
MHRRSTLQSRGPITRHFRHWTSRSQSDRVLLDACVRNDLTGIWLSVVDPCVLTHDIQVLQMFERNFAADPAAHDHQYPLR